MYLEVIVELRIKLAVKDYFHEKLNGTCDIIFLDVKNSFFISLVVFKRK